MEQQQKVSLGCGTLILIAIIVAIFSNSSRDNIRGDLISIESRLNNIQINMNNLPQIQSQLGRIETQLNEQNIQIRNLKEEIRQLNLKNHAGSAHPENPIQNQ
ncbi:MAG: hypothetical protein ABFD69_13655 [Candidatus Sumerlaeia bacterium]